MTTTGTTTAGMIVLRLDDDLELVEVLDFVAEAVAADEDRVFEKLEAAAAAVRDSYTAKFVTTELVVYVVDDTAPSGSVIRFCSVRGIVVNEVGGAAVVKATPELSVGMEEENIIEASDEACEPMSLACGPRLIVCRVAIMSSSGQPSSALRVWRCGRKAAR